MVVSATDSATRSEGASANLLESECQYLQEHVQVFEKRFLIRRDKEGREGRMEGGSST